MTRVIAYVDGFNLYFGLRSKGWKKYYWLDLPRLATSQLKPFQSLIGTHYFTSRICSDGNNADDVRRQSTYLDALVTQGAKIHEGHYLEKRRRCHACGATWVDYEEKLQTTHEGCQRLSQHRRRLATKFSASRDCVHLVRSPPSPSRALEMIHPKHSPTQAALTPQSRRRGSSPFIHALGFPRSVHPRELMVV
jgi:hypothetical protein